MLPYLIVVGLFANVILVIGTLMDAFSTPAEVWRAEGHNRAAWVMLILLTAAIGAVIYLIVVRPGLRQQPATE